jgi:hypothetical protein
MLPAGSYHCDCSKYCKNLRKVSKATFYNHAKYRNQDCYGSSNAHRSLLCVTCELTAIFTLLLYITLFQVPEILHTQIEGLLLYCYVTVGMFTRRGLRLR